MGSERSVSTKGVFGYQTHHAQRLVSALHSAFTTLKDPHEKLNKPPKPAIHREITPSERDRNNGWALGHGSLSSKLNAQTKNSHLELNTFMANNSSPFRGHLETKCCEERLDALSAVSLGRRRLRGETTAGFKRRENCKGQRRSRGQRRGRSSAPTVGSSPDLRIVTGLSCPWDLTPRTEGCAQLFPVHQPLGKSHFFRSFQNFLLHAPPHSPACQSV